MTGKSTVLQRLREALGEQRPSFDEALAARREALGEAPSPRPQWSGDTLSRMLERLEAAAASCERISELAQVPERVTAWLGDAVQPRKLRLAPHDWLRGLQWPADWEVESGVGGEPDWPVAVTVASAGVAETGTLVLPSGPQTPTSLNFLPDYHVVVLRADSVVDHLEDLWPQLNQQALPRTVNLITGPSRTADVEQTIQLGAHGPRRLHVLLWTP